MGGSTLTKFHAIQIYTIFIAYNGHLIEMISIFEVVLISMH